MRFALAAPFEQMPFAADGAGDVGDAADARRSLSAGDCALGGAGALLALGA